MARPDVERLSPAALRDGRGESGASAQDPRGFRAVEMKRPVGVLLVGSAGRMGQAIIEAAQMEKSIAIAGQCEIGDAIGPALAACDVVIDFSHPDASGEICRAVTQGKKALVVGTTGHSAEQRRQIEQCAQSVPVVFSSNFSVGVNALFWLTRKAAEMLGADFDLEIVDMHHRMKKDAPSGTAVTLAEILKGARKIAKTRYGREGQGGEIEADEIGIHSVGGGVGGGDPTVLFAGTGERLE